MNVTLPRVIGFVLAATFCVGLALISGHGSAPSASANLTLTWGDPDCNGSVAPRDGQAILNHFLGQTELSQSQPCPAIGDTVTIDGVSYIWGDPDCNGSVAPRDGQAILNHFLGQTELSQSQPCPDFGSTVTLGAGSSPTPTPSPTPSPTPTSGSCSGSVQTRKGTWYVDSSSDVWAVGEVCNGLDHPVEFVAITANLYSSSNVLLATSFGFACVTTMPGNSDSDYTVVVISPPPGVDHVGVGVTDYNDPAIDPPIVGLNPAITNVYTDGIEYRHAVGTVTNGSFNTYKLVQPCVAFYDSSGDVIRTTNFTLTSPDTLTPGGSGTFDAGVDDPGGLVTQRIWVDAEYGP